MSIITPNIKIIRSKRKSITLTIDNNSIIIVKAPFFTPTFVVNKFIKDHYDWIQKQLNRQSKKVAKKYENGEEFLFLGAVYKLDIGNYKDIAAVDKTLRFPSFLKFRIQKQLASWYIKHAKLIITQQVKNYSKLMNASYQTITFSDTTSQWGSCNRANKLQFSWRLIMASILVINYVVIHELAHTFQKNHSDKFWEIVEKYIPSYRIQRRWLRKHGNLLHQ